MTGKTTRPQLNFYDHKPTQQLYDSLVTESIQVFGQDMLYVPRRIDDYNEIFNEDDTSFYDTVYGLPVYVRTADGFGGQEAFMTQFGLEVRPQAVFSISRYQFELNIRANEVVINRPREGDLLFFPMNNRIFEIKYTDNKPFFYQGGALQMYDVTVELYEYAGERFLTGIPEIDEIQKRFSVDVFEYDILTRDGATILGRTDDIITVREFGENEEEYSPTVQNDDFQEYANNDGQGSLIWREDNPFAAGRY